MILIYTGLNLYFAENLLDVKAHAAFTVNTASGLRENPDSVKIHLIIEKHVQTQARRSHDCRAC